MQIKKIENKDLKGKIAKEILDDLPRWFGDVESKNEYIEDSLNLDFFACYLDDLPIGFLTLKENSADTLEIDVIGVLYKYRNQGAGKRLVLYAFEYAKKEGYSFLEVKTVAGGHYSEYDETNAFYKAMGFKSLEIIKELWAPHIPCQIYVKSIK